jgi:nitric oxide reductase NorQ protein
MTLCDSSERVDRGVPSGAPPTTGGMNLSENQTLEEQVSVQPVSTNPQAETWVRKEGDMFKCTFPECTYEKPYFHGVVRHYYFQHYKGDSVYRQEGDGFICSKCGKNYSYDVNVVEHYYREHVSGGKLYDVIPLNHFFDKGETIQEEKKDEKKVETTNGVGFIPQGIEFVDWGNFMEVLEIAYKSRQPVLIIGPKGTGKTTLIQAFCEKHNIKLYTANFSLRTKEEHIIGRIELKNNSTVFVEGILPKSMEAGGVFYADELNAAEDSMLVRFDEALDDRRQLTLKEAGEIRVIKAKETWFPVSTVNPLSHAGTRELPPQLLSRFPVRLYMDYPSEDVIYQIVNRHVEGWNEEEVKRAVMLMNKLKEGAGDLLLPYSPSIREVIAFAKLVKAGVNGKKAAVLVFENVYYQWGSGEAKKVDDLITSIWPSD